MALKWLSQSQISQTFYNHLLAVAKQARDQSEYFVINPIGYEFSLLQTVVLQWLAVYRQTERVLIFQ